MSRPVSRAPLKIFISYRRDDSGGDALHLLDNLRARFGKGQVFMDIEGIEPGANFAKVIEAAVGSCDVLLALIGQRWLTLTERDGVSRRLDNPKDFVRLELAAALKRDVSVIPILVQGAAVLSEQDLPDALKELSGRNAFELSHRHWEHDASKLIEFLEKIQSRKHEEQSREVEAVPELPSTRRTLLVAAMAAIALIGVVTAAVLLKNRLSASATQTAATPTATVSATPQTQTEEPKKNPEPPADMVYVPGGEFTMGRDNNSPYEKPAHRVTVLPFLIDVHEVTCEKYEECVKAKRCNPPAGCGGGTFLPDMAHKPVSGVTWDDAHAYADWVGKRLPTEAEWEFAARGTDGRLYPWEGPWKPGLANANRASKGMVDVGTYKKGASPFGALDMVGNAWEWTVSEFKPYSDKHPWKVTMPGDLKVIRGGTYLSDTTVATTTYRAGWPARGSDDYSNTGFRCVQDIAR